MNFKKLKKQLSVGLLFVLPFSVAAQTEEINNATPLVHNLKHSDLLTDQVKINKEINLLDSVVFKYKLQEEADEELTSTSELYSSSWDSRFVNPYKNMDIQVPDTFKISTALYSMPIGGDYIKLTDVYGYRPRRRRMHYGVDMKVQTGDTIYAAFDGTVRLTRYDRRGYGYHIVLRHSNGLETVYGHLSKYLVKLDQEVKVGQPIALGGNTGRSYGSHLHFETRFLGITIDPEEIFDFANLSAREDTYVFRNKKSKTPTSVKRPPLGTLAQKSGTATPSVQSKPTASSAMAEDNGTPNFHVIRSGDMLGKISIKYKVSVNELCRLNGITKTTTLNLGQKIRLK